MDKWNEAGSATLRGLVSGLFEDEAPSDIALTTQTGEILSQDVKPFITFSVLFASEKHSFCSNFLEPIVEFTIHGDANNKSSILLLQISDAFLAVYGDVLLDMEDGYTMVRNDTNNRSKLKDGEKMWNVIIELEFIIEKDR